MRIRGGAAARGLRVLSRPDPRFPLPLARAVSRVLGYYVWLESGKEMMGARGGGQEDFQLTKFALSALEFPPGMAIGWN